MSQIHKHPIPANIAERCLINPDQYKAQYQQSITDPDTFWGEQGKILDWMRPYTRVKNTSFAPGNISIKWYEDGTLNLAANCLDRHLAERGDQTAIIWEGDDASQSKHITYRELHADVCRFANVLLDLGIKKATWSLSICRWCRKPRWRCWPAPASGQSTRSFSAASRRRRWPDALSTPAHAGDHR